MENGSRYQGLHPNQVPKNCPGSLATKLAWAHPKIQSTHEEPPSIVAWTGPEFQIVRQDSLSDEQAASESWDLDIDKVFIGDLDSDNSSKSDDSKESEEKDGQKPELSSSELTFPPASTDHESSNKCREDDIDLNSNVDDVNTKDGGQEGYKDQDMATDLIGGESRENMVGMMTRGRRRQRTDSNSEFQDNSQSY
jgi:hypothetical protein